MLNPFPILLSFGLLAPLLLRMAIGIYFLKVGLDHLKLNSHTAKEIAAIENSNVHPAASIVWGIAALEAICGLALIAGFLTQIAASLLGLLALIAVILKQKNNVLFGHSKSFYLLVFAICASLLFSGAGFLAVDMPL